MAQTESILVTGGTGTLGLSVVRRLLDSGTLVRMSSRRRPAALELLAPFVPSDLLSGEGLEAAVAGTTAIIHCATTRGRGDVEATRQLIHAARRTGEPHLVYISIVGIDAVPLAYYRAKLEAERLVQESGLPWTILRTTQFHDLIAWMSSAQRWSPVIMAPAGVSYQPIDVREVADRLVDIAAQGPAGRVPDMGGPQVRSAVDLARTWARARGRRRPVVAVPAPGKAMRAFRQGAHLTPENAVGRITFEQFLADPGW